MRILIVDDEPALSEHLARALRDAGYADPMPIAPEDEAAQLQREFITAVKALEGIQQRLARNGSQVQP